MIRRFGFKGVLTGALFALLLCWSARGSARETPPHLSAREIMDKVYHRDDGQDSEALMRMVLIDKHGIERRRRLRVYRKDFGPLSRSLLEFLEPPDIARTRFLSIENPDKDDTQYLYLPALGRARRIVSSQKKMRFVNTDFTYEDMQRRPPSKDVHRLLGETSWQGYAVYQIESMPLPKTSQYGKRVHWVDKASWVIVGTDFFDKKGRKIKEFRVNRLENVQGIWTAMEDIMRDLKAHHQTRLTIEEVQYNQGLPENLFTKRYLEEE